MASSSDVDSTLLLFLPGTILSPAIAAGAALISFALLLLFPGGVAWAFSRGKRSIPGPSGFFMPLSGASAHRALASAAKSLRATKLMSFSVGVTRFIVSSHPETAKEILNSSSFADRPIKESAYELLFHRAMGFAPFGDYWRNLRRISSTYLFSPKRISRFGKQRMDVGVWMAGEISDFMARDGVVEVKRVLHFGSLNNVMMTVFGKRFDFGDKDGIELEGLVKEGYELLGMFNWSDHLPLFGVFDIHGVKARCRKLVERVNVFVNQIIEDHRRKMVVCGGGVDEADQAGDFVDVLLNLEKEEKLSDSDMVAVLWEMIFRGTDTVAILLEWIMARMVLHPDIQAKVQAEIDAVTNGNSRPVTDSDVKNLPFLQAVVKESLRMHPPGPLLSWARLAVHDVHVGDHFVPAGTTAMVNMWSIAHDAGIWSDPEEFKPERFVSEDVNILGSDLRLAPFGAGRRVCPGKTMALATVHLWLAQLLQKFEWAVDAESGLDLSECLKMSLEMKNPLACRAVARV
ncbi:Cytochrome P450 78A4 [Platanthera guangdongensis]|uniref:Cytochrome P450 78A4 n=1 Tax=Platanthera guangdongensis TaxID=2320717 RepID=A0ABR2MI98_9ASPA